MQMGRDPTSQISQILDPEFICISVVYSIYSSWETETSLTDITNDTTVTDLAI